MRDTTFMVPEELPEHVRPTWELYLHGFTYKRIAKQLRLAKRQVRWYMQEVRFLFPYWTRRLYRNNCAERDLTRESKPSKREYLDQLRAREGKPPLPQGRIERRGPVRWAIIAPKELHCWP